MRHIDPYLEFILYRAHCNDDAGSEGPFNERAEDDYSKRRCKRAMEIVQKYLSYKEDRWIHIDGIISSEEDAKNLIEYAQKNIEHSESTIRLIQSIHGHIVFERILTFKGYDYPQTKEVADKLKSSKVGFLERISDMAWMNFLRSFG
jgi:hypothetical protein